MMNHTWCALVIVLLVALTACDGQVDDASLAGPGYHEDVFPIFQGKCTQCHGVDGVAPIRLDRYDDAYAARAAISVAVESGAMPPWIADDSCGQSYMSDWSLSAEQIATIALWAKGDAREGDPTVRNPPVETASVMETLSRQDIIVSMPRSYEPVTVPDDYRCFILDWPEQEDVFVTGFTTLPGNDKIVHHVISFVVPPEEVPAYEELDAADPGPGYECFGGPGRITNSLGWLGAWAPGGKGTDFPEGTGILVRPGSKIIFQVHYNTWDLQGITTDTSGMAFKVDNEIERRAALTPFVDPSWVWNKTMPIDAGDGAARHSFEVDMTLALNGFSSGQLDSYVPFTIHAAALHMHKLGRSAQLTLIRSDGTQECVLSIRDWDFDWQRNFRLMEPLTFNPGDRLRVTCEWDNTEANQPDGRPVRDVNWGDGTYDEMCLGILYLSEI